uniref:SAM domain-containing protein n=1 Tax=Pristionchus pacificus TaxID=54126 RepID=A0A8R1UAS9_PRIPA
MKFHLLIIFPALILGDERGKKTRNVEVTAEEEKIRDRRGFEAIAEIHKEMDDDHSGSIDRTESSGFMAEDMNMRSTERARREKAFHGEDDAITVDDLWEAWFESSERSWTTQEFVYWLVNVVNLPQYAPLAEAMQLDGKVLPRLAVLNSTFMNDKFKVKSSVHRQKLRLTALDVVLFGYRDNSSRAKDIALAALLVLLSMVIALMMRQRRRARVEMNSLANQLEELNSMKSHLEDTTEKMKEERSRRQTNDGHEVQQLKNQLDEANKKLEISHSGGTAPLILQPLLRKTCEVELNYLNKQRAECVVEMKGAIDEVDKLRKKQATLVASLKLATGASTGSDQIDAKIFGLKSRMESIQATTREAQERWMEIEALCGFPILYINENTTTSSSSSVARVKSSIVSPSSTHPSSSSSVPTFYKGGGESGSDSSSSISSMDRSSTLRHSSSLPMSPTSVNGSIASTHPSERFIVRDEYVNGTNNSPSTSSISTLPPQEKKRKRDVLKSIFSKNKVNKVN